MDRSANAPTSTSGAKKDWSSSESPADLKRHMADVAFPHGESSGQQQQGSDAASDLVFPVSADSLAPPASTHAQSFGDKAAYPGSDAANTREEEARRTLSSDADNSNISSSSSSTHPHGVTGYVKEVGSHIAESFREAGHKLAEGFRGHKADDDTHASSWASTTAPYTAAGSSSASVLGPSHGSLLRDDENMITNDEAQHQQPAARAADNVVTDSASTATSFLPSLFSSSSSSNSSSSNSTHMPDMNITTRSNYDHSHTSDSSRGKSINDTSIGGQSSSTLTSSDASRFSPNVSAPTDPAPVGHLFREPDRTEADRDSGNWASKWVGGKDSGSSSSSSGSADKASSRVPGGNDLDPRIVEDVSRTE